MKQEQSNHIEKEEYEIKKKSKESFLSEKDQYSFGWSKYAETTNGRFAMLGLLAILMIEIFSKQSFLNWSGILN